jgi:hypothetical protein
MCNALAWNFRYLSRRLLLFEKTTDEQIAMVPSPGSRLSRSLLESICSLKQLLFPMLTTIIPLMENENVCLQNLRNFMETVASLMIMQL